MKIKLIQALSLVLALLLQVAPLLRSLMPNSSAGLAPSTWATVLKLGVGAAALMGFDAISQASSIAILPGNATVGQLYTGTVSYSGSHAGSINSMQVSNNCLGSVSLGNNLTITYAGGNKASVTGTPTTAQNLPFTVTAWSGSSCGGSHKDTRSTSLVIGAGGNTTNAPIISAVPPNTVAQVGSDVQLSGGASGNPIPQYQWWQGFTAILGATNTILTLTNVHLTDAGVYTLTASNTANIGNTFITLPKANCYLSICVSGGTNFAALEFTNFAPAGVPMAFYSYITNANTVSNFYAWTYNYGSTKTNSNTYLKTPIPLDGGTYTIRFDSTNSTAGYIVTNQQYDSYWAFGYRPNFTNQLPASTNLNAGSNVTFTVALQGTLDVYNPGGGNPIKTNATPCVFWYRDATLVASQIFTNGPTSGATYTNLVVFPSLTLNNVTGANAGSYTVVATNFWGSVTSSPTVLSVTGGGGTAPSITVPPPANLGLLAGQSSAIRVTATGTAPLAYQWRKASANLADGGVFGGVLTSNLTLTAVVTGNAGNYDVVITNSSGAITSSITTLIVSPPPSLGASAISPGNIQLSGNTVTGLTYVVQRSTNLASPSWIPIRTNNTGVSGAISFQTNSTSAPNAFYRLTFP